MIVLLMSAFAILFLGCGSGPTAEDLADAKEAKSQLITEQNKLESEKQQKNSKSRPSVFPYRRYLLLGYLFFCSQTPTTKGRWILHMTPQGSIGPCKTP